MLMVIVFTWHVRSFALAAHHVKHSLSLPHRCCVHYTPLVVLLLFVHRYAYSFMLCSYHRFAQLLYSLLRSYFERSQDILCFYSVFFTMPCIFWHCPRRRGFCCILYNNISILSSLTTRLACWLLQHYLYPFFLHVPFSKNTECPQARAQNWPKIVSTLRCFYHISIQPEYHTAQKIHRFSRYMYAIPRILSLLRVNAMRATLMSSQGTISCARDTLRLQCRQK